MRTHLSRGPIARQVRRRSIGKTVQHLVPKTGAAEGVVACISMDDTLRLLSTSLEVRAAVSVTELVFPWYRCE